LIVCCLRRRDPRDVAVRSDQEGIGGSWLHFASGRHHINSISPTRSCVAKGRPIREIEQNSSAMVHEPWNAGLARSGDQRKIRRPVAQQGVPVATADVNFVVNLYT
jgi:hypothetical protein